MSFQVRIIYDQSDAVRFLRGKVLMAEGDTKMMTDEFERAFAAKKDTFTVKYRLPQF